MLQQIVTRSSTTKTAAAALRYCYSNLIRKSLPSTTIVPRSVSLCTATEATSKSKSTLTSRHNTEGSLHLLPSSSLPLLLSRSRIRSSRCTKSKIVMSSSSLSSSMRVPNRAASTTASVTEPTTTVTIPRKKRLTMDTLSDSILKMEYAVRGKVVIAADEIANQLRNKSKEYPFDRIIYTNIGNPQSVGQQPLTWPRQVLALVDLPNDVGVDHPHVHDMFPQDAIERAKVIRQQLVEGGSGGSSGSYSHSKGVPGLRNDVVHFLQERDGVEVPVNVENIFLTSGASQGITNVLQALISEPGTDGVMIPIPQYPIYSATLDMFNGKQVGYYLNEENNWSLDMNELRRSLHDATDNDQTNVVGLVLINPGNPTGQVLTKENLYEVVQFCYDNSLVLLADEVYQENVYDASSEFISCKRAAYDLGLLGNGSDDGLELISFHSISKGVYGECGRRGGYMELCNIDDDVVEQFYKLASVSLCSPVNGQIMTSLMVRGPKPTDTSYENHEREKRTILHSLAKRANIVESGLNNINGFTCQTAAGSMYCFPSITIPQKAVEEASKQNITPDTLYSVSLLQRTGICVVPASGFKQRSGRYGFRTTFLPSEEEMQNAIQRIEKHYIEFCNQYA